MTEPLPTSSLQLRSLVTEQGTLELSLVDVSLPTLASDEVLVRVEAAPINPSDLALLLAGANVASAVVEGTAERPIVTTPLTDGALRSSRPESASRWRSATKARAPWWRLDPRQRQSRSSGGRSRSRRARCTRSTVR